MPLPLEEKRNRVLLSAYDLHTTKSRHINVYELERLADVGPEFYDILRYFGTNGKGWLKKANEVVRLTAEGIDRAEEMKNERFEDKLNRLFQLLYNERHNRHTKQFVPDELAAALDLDVPEVMEIISILDSKGWLGGNDEGVNINAAGILEFERRREPPTPATNVMYINQNYAPVAQGSNFTQSVTQIRNEFDDSIRKLLQAVEESEDLSAVQKITVKNDINMVHQLAHMEKTPEVIETVSTKIDGINSVVSSTADLVSLGVVVIPIVRAFFGL